MRGWLTLGLVAWVGVFGSAGGAVLWTEALGEEAVVVRAIDADGAVRCGAAGEAERVWSAGTWARLRMDGAGVGGGVAREQAGAAALLRTTDGQALPGTLAADLSVVDAVVWDHAALGRLVVPLESVASVTFGGGAGETPIDAPATAWAGEAVDRVVLSNGDELRGFLASCDAGALAFVPAGEREAVTLAAARVARVVLANEPAPAAGRWTVGLRDGSVLHGGALTLSEGALRVAATLHAGSAAGGAARPDSSVPAYTLELPASSVAWVSRGERAAVVDLMDRPWSVAGGGEVFGWPARVRVRGGSARLRGPISVSCELPAGATRVRVRVALDDAGAPPEFEAEADCVVRVEGLTGVEPARLWRGRRGATLVGTPTGDALTVTLEAGENGPILDRVTLEAVALVPRGDTSGG